MTAFAEAVCCFTPNRAESRLHREGSVEQGNIPMQSDQSFIALASACS
jgi:hypothetical protein